MELTAKCATILVATRTDVVRTGGAYISRIHVKTRCLLVTCLLLCCIAPGARAAERELHWDALDVEAHLNADGGLDVIERHTMVFTGEWNGGERVFNVRPRQKFEFVGLERVDATGST